MSSAEIIVRQQGAPVPQLSSDPSWIADIPRSNLDGLRRPVVTARASDTHGPTATFPKLPMQKNLVGGLLIAKYG